jgi:hypothetical protein
VSNRLQSQRPEGRSEKLEFVEVVLKRLMAVFVGSLALASTLSAQTLVIVAQPDPGGAGGVLRLGYVPQSDVRCDH